LYIHVRFTDRNGHETLFTSKEFSFDPSPPAISLTESTTLPTNEDIEITAIVSDAHIGVKLIKWASGERVRG